MVMNIEIMESYGDYSALTSGDAPFNSYWILSGSSNASFGAGALDATDRAMLMNDNSNGFSSNHLRMFATGVAKVTASIGFNLNNLGSGSLNPLLQITDTAGVAQVDFRFTNIGKFILTGEGGATVATSQGNYTTGVIYRCCLRFELTGPNVGNCAVSINGYDDPGLTAVGVDLQDTANQNFGGVRTYAITGSPAGNGGDWDLLHLMVGTGEVEDWGPLEITDNLPNIDILKEWTPLSGTDNFAMVDEPQPDADTTYNRSETVGQKDIFGFPDMEVPEKVICVGLVSWAKKEDSATRKFRHVIRMGGVDYPGIDIFAAETYGRHLDTFELDPSTGLAWDPADLPSVDAGYEYVGA